MTTGEPPLAVSTYPARKYAAEFAAVLREHGISAAVVPSNQHVGEWDVLVPAHDAARATTVVHDLLTPD